MALIYRVVEARESSEQRSAVQQCPGSRHIVYNIITSPWSQVPSGRTCTSTTAVYGQSCIRLVFVWYV